MNIFDLIFLAVFLTACVKLVRVIFAAIDGHKSRLTHDIQQLAALVLGYLGVVVLVSLLTPGKVLNMGEKHCTDDWCVTVDEITHIYNDSLYVCTLELEVTGRRRSMPWREKHLQVYVLDGEDRRYYPVKNPEAVPREKSLEPKKSTTITQKFNLPKHIKNPGLVTSHNRFPGLFVIRDEQSLFHKKTIIRIR